MCCWKGCKVTRLVPIVTGPFLVEGFCGGHIRPFSKVLRPGYLELIVRCWRRVLGCHICRIINCVL
jgi:hypothetical protein